jgi:hypothetical protein
VSRETPERSLTISVRSVATEAALVCVLRIPCARTVVLSPIFEVFLTPFTVVYNDSRLSLTRQAVLEFVRALGYPVNASEVRDAYGDRGIVVSSQSIGRSLARLADREHLLVRTSDRRYVAAPSEAL